MKRRDLQRIGAPPEVNLDALCDACNLVIQAYLDGTVVRQARAWKWLRKFATSKASRAFQEIAQTLFPQDFETPRVQLLAKELEQLPERAGQRARYYGPANEKEQFYIQVMRGWTNAGGRLGASSKKPGPLQRLLCLVAEQVNQELHQRKAGGAVVPKEKFLKLKLLIPEESDTASGARDIIRREQRRRKRLPLAEGSVPLGGQSNLEAEAYLIDEFGHRIERDDS